jgi:ferrous iron transport protein A
LSLSRFVLFSLFLREEDPPSVERFGKASLTPMTMGMDLARAPLDTALTLVQIDGSAENRRRLATLGLREGAAFRLLTRTIGGGRILLVAGSRIAIGRELVRQLRAEAA